MIKIKHGLDLPITGAPEQVIHDGNKVSHVAVLGDDYVGMKPTMKVQEGDEVISGQVLFSDKKNEGVHFTAPVSGTISAINRGAKRKLLSVVIERKGEESVEFKQYSSSELASLAQKDVKEQMVRSGLWTALRARPFSKIPPVSSETDVIFVTAMDTHPLAADPTLVIKEKAQAFEDGLVVLGQLTNKTVFVCTAPESKISIPSNDKIKKEEFAGPHPAGLPGTHIHFLFGADAKHQAWYIGYQDVIALGELFTTGRINAERVISIAGPAAKNPRLVRTFIGADLTQLLVGEVESGDVRIISGSVFSGFAATKARAFLGRYHNQVSLILEGREKEFFGWLLAGTNKFSVTRSFISHLTPSKLFAFNTGTGGSERAIMPIGSYERVMPLDILATPLLRALVTGDNDTAQALGCMELDEEDLALATFVCPGKYEYGPILRNVLDAIEKDG